MYKEVIIVIIIVILVITANIITQNNTKNTVELISNQLYEVKSKIFSKNINKEDINKINDIWDEKFEKMAYYIEHDELEKVSTELTKLKADIETENYEFAIENLENCIFILEHIKDKSSLKIVNIF